MTFEVAMLKRIEELNKNCFIYDKDKLIKGIGLYEQERHIQEHINKYSPNMQKVLIQVKISAFKDWSFFQYLFYFTNYDKLNELDILEKKIRNQEGDIKELYKQYMQIISECEYVEYCDDLINNQIAKIQKYL